MPRMKQMLRESVVSFLVTTEKWCKGGAKILPSYWKSLKLEQKSAARSVCLFYVCAGLVLPCEPRASIKRQEWIQEHSPDGPTLCWRLIWDATLHCATHRPQLVVGQATWCKSTLLARLLFGTCQATYKVLSWDAVYEYDLPVSLDTAANGSLLILAFLFLLVTYYSLLFCLIVAFLSAIILLNRTGTEPGLKNCLTAIPTNCYQRNAEHYPGESMGQGLLLINRMIKIKPQVGR